MMTILFADPTLFIFGFAGAAGLAGLVMLLRQMVIQRWSTWRGAGASGGNSVSNGSGLLLVYTLAWLGWMGVQAAGRLQSARLAQGFDLYMLDRMAIYLLLLLALVFYQLTRVFLRRVRPGWGEWAAGLLWLAAAAGLYEYSARGLLRTGDWVIGALRLTPWQTAFYLIVAGWLACVVASLALAGRGFRWTAAPLHRNRIGYWWLALTFTAAGSGLFFLRAAVPASLLHLAGYSVMVYALLTHDLPDLRSARRRVISYLIMLALTVAVYTAGFLLIERAALSQLARDPGGQLIPGMLLALTLAVLFNPLLGLVQRFVAHWTNSARYDARETLAVYSQRISNILEMEALAAVVSSMLDETMDISHGGLVTVRLAERQPFPTGLDEEAWREIFPTSEIGQYILRLVGGPEIEPREGRLQVRNPVAYFLSREHRPLTQYDIDLQPRFSTMDSSERAWLSGLHVDVFVPVYSKENWIGLLALGPKRSGDRYFEEDLTLLQALADQTAVALENARLVEDLRLRNAENERLNTELTSANAELAQLDQAKSNFINVASHELRTPLTQVIGYNEILADMMHGGPVDPATGGQMVASVRKAARRLAEIVETMFDATRLDTRTLDLMMEPVDLADVVDAAMQTWAAGLADRNQTLEVSGMDDLPFIEADSKRMVQVFTQLLQNAIKFSPDGGHITIRGRVVEEIPRTGQTGAALTEEWVEGDSGQNDGKTGPLALAARTPLPAPVDAELLPGEEPDAGFVEVVVADNGIGIAAEDLERIFQKFYRVGSTLLHSSGDTKFQGAGPGLGLTIARGIVEAHGGRIWAESPGHNEQTCPGAAFHVLLPVLPG